MKHYVTISAIIFLMGCQQSTSFPAGGFDYPQNLSVKDTNLFFYQLVQRESKRDSFQDSYAYLFYRPFDEPNLSIRPQDDETFRLTFSSISGASVIIKLTEKFIIVKEGNAAVLYINDTSKLAPIERVHLRILKRKFPIDLAKEKPGSRIYLDSMIKLYPQLMDPEYYRMLYEKTVFCRAQRLNYQEKRIEISSQQFNWLIEQFNESGFWSFPLEVKCQFSPNDGDGFLLEANTKKKYKIVRTVSCPGDSSKFTKACQELVKFAKMEHEINLLWSGEIKEVE